MLDRAFEAPAPNRKWIADFTYIWTAEGWLCVAAVLDLFSRRVVGWSMSATMTAQLVADALDSLPPALTAQFANVLVVVEDEHPDEPDLLGLYEGIPLTEREAYSGVLPDRISLFRLPLCHLARDLDELVHEIGVTVVHEFAHHVGIDDERLHELGWA